MNATIEQLQTLKLFGMLEAWNDQKTQPTYQDLSFDERFSLLVEREHLRRQLRRQARRLKQAKLPQASNPSIEAVDYSIDRGLAKTH